MSAVVSISEHRTLGTGTTGIVNANRVGKCGTPSWGYKPRVQMTGQELQTLLNACHDYGTVHEGDFPNLEALLQAQAECRLRATDLCSQGEILIVGRDACYVTFKVDE